MRERDAQEGRQFCASRAKETPAQEDWKALVQRWIMGWKRILIKVVVTESRVESSREAGARESREWGWECLI